MLVETPGAVAEPEPSPRRYSRHGAQFLRCVVPLRRRDREVHVVDNQPAAKGERADRVLCRPPSGQPVDIRVTAEVAHTLADLTKVEDRVLRPHLEPPAHMDGKPLYDKATFVRG